MTTDQPTTHDCPGSEGPSGGRREGPVPDGAPAVDGMGRPLRYDHTGRLWPTSAVDRAIFDLETRDEALAEVAVLAGFVGRHMAERIADGEADGLDAVCMALASVLGRTITVDGIETLFPLDDALEVPRPTGSKVLGAIRERILEAQAAAADDRGRPTEIVEGTGAYL